MEIYYREKHVALQAMKIFIINISAVMIINISSVVVNDNDNTSILM